MHLEAYEKQKLTKIIDEAFERLLSKPLEITSDKDSDIRDVATAYAYRQIAITALKSEITSAILLAEEAE